MKAVNRRCAFCAIPIITGKHVSRSQESILEEVRELVALGVKEFQIIAQELTYYGVDVDGKQHIAELVEAISDVPGVKWIRLHYAYPAHFPFELLRVMRERDNVCNYLDIALQHISDHLLSSMHGRKVYMDDDANQECFRAYKNAKQSYEDHSKFLTSNARYQKLFRLKVTDYKGWAKGLKECVVDGELAKFYEIEVLIVLVK